jgi:lipopolysaccharide/colanic/teichoic acid biosynthesis glycosyltransferase/nucleoside-diphosphate-sugar epimerase
MKGIVLVVGSGGFVGHALVEALVTQGWTVKAAARREQSLPSGAAAMRTPDLMAENPDFSVLLSDVDVVVYLAARVHVMKDPHPDPLAAYRSVNTRAAVILAQQAAQAGARRMVYLSSVKVNGEISAEPFRESDPPQPTDLYGLSKFEAEKALEQVAQATGLEIVIIRPPLVYGPGVKANFASLLRAARLGVPIPIGAVTARRSLVYLGNLTDLLIRVLDHPRAANETFFVSDCDDLSPPDLVRRLAAAQGRKSRVPNVPLKLLQLLGRLTGRSATIERLTQPLQVDVSKARSLLSWTPPFPLWQAIARTVADQVPAAPMCPRNTENQSSWSLSASQQVYLRIREVTEKIVAMMALVCLCPLCMVLALLIRVDSPGSPLFVQERAGRGHVPFRMYKFRTMRKDTPQLSTEEMQRTLLNPVTRVGGFLRRTSLDELPQLVNVVLGQMSFIGPRPALMTQSEVLKLRAASGVDQLTPGITGYAQVTGRDDLGNQEKVRQDTVYLQSLGLAFDSKILAMTINSVLRGTGNK